MGWVDGLVALLCLLTAAALPARAGSSTALAVLAVAGVFAGGALLWLLTRTGEAATTVAAVAIGGWAMIELLRPVRPRASAVAAGAAAGAAALLYWQAGAPWWLALPVCTAVPVAVLALTARGALRDGRLRDEALVGITWAALLGAFGPALMTGWESAIALNQAGEEAAATPAAPEWVWFFVALAAGAGLLRGWWTKR